MKREEIATKVSEEIERLMDLDKGDVKENSSLSCDLEVDSLDSVEILMNLEKEFDISIKDEEWDNLKKVSDIIDIVEDKLK